MVGTENGCIIGVEMREHICGTQNFVSRVKYCLCKEIWEMIKYF